jgi:hypothetical protein
MGDSSMSASELRQRYLSKDGLSDDQLSASQLRARHGIERNKNWSAPAAASSSPSPLVLAAGLLAAALLAGVGYMLYTGGLGGK